MFHGLYIYVVTPESHRYVTGAVRYERRRLFQVVIVTRDTAEITVNRYTLTHGTMVQVRLLRYNFVFTVVEKKNTERKHWF